MTTNHFPGQEHLPHHPAAAAAKPAAHGSTANPSPPVQPAPHPVARRATAIKCAIDIGTGDGMTNILIRAKQIDEFLQGQTNPDHGDQIIVNVTSGSHDIRQAAETMTKRLQNRRRY